MSNDPYDSYTYFVVVVGFHIIRITESYKNIYRENGNGNENKLAQPR